MWQVQGTVRSYRLHDRSRLPGRKHARTLKFAFVRVLGHNLFDENKASKEGYRLSWLGQALQNFLMRVFPDQSCNIYVLIARKPA